MQKETSLTVIQFQCIFVLHPDRSCGIPKALLALVKPDPLLLLQISLNLWSIVSNQYIKDRFLEEPHEIMLRYPLTIQNFTFSSRTNRSFKCPRIFSFEHKSNTNIEEVVVTLSN